MALGKTRKFGKRLTGLSIGEVSGVDRPATGEPFLILKAEGAPDPTDDEIAALIKEAIEEEPMDFADALSKAREEMTDDQKALADALAKSLKGEAPDDVIAKAEADAAIKAERDRADRLEKALNALSGNTPEPDAEAEALAKAMDALPEPIRKMVEANNARLADAERIAKAERDARLEREYLEKAKGYGVVVGKPETAATWLRKAEEKLSKEEFSELDRVLKSAAHAIANPDSFREIGGPGADVTDSQVALKAEAEALRKAEPTLTEAEAFVKAADMNPALLNGKGA